jgi:hypothetical protein
LHWPNGDFTKAYLDEVADAKAAAMASCCRIPKERFLRWMEAETRIDAVRALDVGLVDEVPGMIKPRLPVVFL